MLSPLFLPFPQSIIGSSGPRLSEWPGQIPPASIPASPFPCSHVIACSGLITQQSYWLPLCLRALFFASQVCPRNHSRKISPGVLALSTLPAWGPMPASPVPPPSPPALLHLTLSGHQSSWFLDIQCASGFPFAPALTYA